MIENRRVDRLNSLIQRELSEIIHRSVKDPRVRFCTVSQIEVSPDLRYADIKISIIGDQKQKRATMAGLKSATGFLRREIGRKIGLRYAPELRFMLDDSADHIEKIDRLVRQVHNEEEQIKHQQSSIGTADSET